MKPKRLAALLLIAFTLLSLQSAALANAAEPPSFIIIVSNPPDGLELSIPSGAPGAEPYVLQKTVKGWESHYRYFYGGDPDSGRRKDELTVKYGDTLRARKGEIRSPVHPRRGGPHHRRGRKAPSHAAAHSHAGTAHARHRGSRVLPVRLPGKKELAGVFHREPRHSDRSEPALPRHFTGLYVGDRLLSAGNAYSRH